MKLQDEKNPEACLNMLLEGNARYTNGAPVAHNYQERIAATAGGQSPSAVILSCIDSRVPVEQVFDVSVGDVFSVRVAGNISGTKSLGSIEYAVGVSGVKLVMVLGHTRCGAATAAVEAVVAGENPSVVDECVHLPSIIDGFKPVATPDSLSGYADSDDKAAIVDEIAKQNVIHTCNTLISQSPVISRLVQEGEVQVVGAMYNVATGEVTLV